MYVVIMAGGGGKRLRPMSTATLPKPFLPLLPTGETLLQRTVARLLDGPELGLPPGSIFVVTAAAYAPLVRAQVPGVGVLEEPEGRNTAAAIALATLAIDRDEDDVMVVLPADHRIDPAREGAFRFVLAAAVAGLTGHPFGIDLPLATLGVQPTGPSVEYGYLLPRPDAGTDLAGLRAYPLAAFREKPPRDEAVRLFGQPGVAWNAGMFLWRRRAIREALQRCSPAVMTTIADGLARHRLGSAYASLEARSIDYEVMEPAARDARVVMGTMDVGWTDVGTWASLLEVLEAPRIEGEVVEAGRPVTLSAEDLIIERLPTGLVVRDGADGTIIPSHPIAVLQRARAARPIVQALLDRCAAAEARS
jgi:mannose-1-phosphate guanylyltransferase